MNEGDVTDGSDDDDGFTDWNHVKLDQRRSVRSDHASQYTRHRQTNSTNFISTDDTSNSNNGCQPSNIDEYNAQDCQNLEETYVRNKTTSQSINNKDNDSDSIDNLNNLVEQKERNPWTAKDKYDSSSNDATNSGTSVFTNDESTDSDEEEKWSIRVKIISAVDLPSNLIPSIPLYPMFKFGLIPASDSKKIDKLNFNVFTTDHGDANCNKLNNKEKEIEKYGVSTRKSINQNAKFQTQGSFEKCSSSARVKISSGKVLSEQDNGMLEWNEEFRWDSISSPFQTVLVIELCARAILPLQNDPLRAILEQKKPTTYSNSLCIRNEDPSTASTTSSISASDSAAKENKRGKKRQDANNDNTIDGESSGFLGFLRKSRQSMDRRISTTKQTNFSKSSRGSEENLAGTGGKNEFESATRAATVARFLMEKKGASPTFSRSLDVNDKQKVKDELPDFDNVTKNLLKKIPNKYVNQGEPDKEKLNDLRLGTLGIPLTSLPFENERAQIEKWYSLDVVTAAGMNEIGSVKERDGSSGDEGNKKYLAPKRSPSVLLEISFCTSDDLDESEDEAGYFGEDVEKATADNQKQNRKKITEENISVYDKKVMRRNSYKAKEIALQQQQAKIEKNKLIRLNGPYLKPGIVDFLCVVGVKDIGCQKDDGGSKGWVRSIPETCVLEQFPPSDEFHLKNGRNCKLPDKIDWWCFPEGCKVWRGIEPPTHVDLNLKRFSASSPSWMASSIAAFDASLNCTTSFMWWVMSVMPEKYGAKPVKSYGAVIRFYAPAPLGVDSTQDDYAQPVTLSDDGGLNSVISDTSHKTKDKGHSHDLKSIKRLWCPLAICLTSRLPIIGLLEALLLRLCEKLASKRMLLDPKEMYSQIHLEIFNIIVNYPAPIPGVVNCSIPFLSGETDRLLVTLPPSNGLPALPHGASVTSVCRLLGAEGLTVLLAAFLTECKILIHSFDIANLSLVAEVLTALIYPFTWQLPYIPVLPVAKLEILEAPLSYCCGIPSSSMKLIDKSILSDVVVVDLDDGFSSQEYFDGRRGLNATKMPTPLPASVSTNISKAVFRLLREEEEVEEQFGSSAFSDACHLPRIEAESLAEREFRIAVAQQICGLVRGYDDFLFFVSASQPVFNRDRFLREAVTLFEDRKGSLSSIPSLGKLSNASRDMKSNSILSPRSQRFLSALVNTQHFHALLETLEAEDVTFFHQVMETLHGNKGNKNGSKAILSINTYGSFQQEEAAKKLNETLEKVEQKIPNYHVNRNGSRVKIGPDLNTLDFLDEDNFIECDIDERSYIFSFTNEILKPINGKEKIEPMQKNGINSDVSGTHQLSLQHLIDLEKNPWQYCKIFDVTATCDKNNLENTQQSDSSALNLSKNPDFSKWSKIQLRQALGERKFRLWKSKEDKTNVVPDENQHIYTSDVELRNPEDELDLRRLISSASDNDALDIRINETISKKNGDDDPDINLREQDNNTHACASVRLCLEAAYIPTDKSISSVIRSQLEIAKDALRNPSAQTFLISVLSQRPQLARQRIRQRPSVTGDIGAWQRQSNQGSISHLNKEAFDCLTHLCDAMLEACSQKQDYESAYRLLTHTAGFCTMTVLNNTGDDKSNHNAGVVTYMTRKIGKNSFFSDLRLWEKVLYIHQQDRRKDRCTILGESNLNDARSKAIVETDEYEATVSTLYEMLGFGIPAEVLGKFATQVATRRVAEEKCKNLPMLVRRLILKCDDTLENKRFDLLNGSDESRVNISDEIKIGGLLDVVNHGKQWKDITWSHPAYTDVCRTNHHCFSKTNDVIDTNGYSGRSAITCLASLGRSVVATGALDGSIFVAHTINFGKQESQLMDSCNNTDSSFVKGVQLEWGNHLVTQSSNTIPRGKVGGGSVSCLVASKDSSCEKSSLQCDDLELDLSTDEESFLSAASVAKIIAGNTDGDLRVWSMRELYDDYLLTKREDMELTYSSPYSIDSYTQSFRKDKKSLKGKALLGHRGGVTCLDLAPHIYRPDSFFSGGNDGLLKVWSLQPVLKKRKASIGQPPSKGLGIGQPTARGLFSVRENASSSTSRDEESEIEPEEVLAGHGGKVICVKCSWHGARLLSGGVDKTLRLWDLSSSSGKCLNTMYGHSGWITQSHYWGNTTMISGSTDRTIGLWDTRAGSSPLFFLRYHRAPISDIHLGSRTEFRMVSAGADGAVATWDFRQLSGQITGRESAVLSSKAEKDHILTRTIRNPVASMNHCIEGHQNKYSGSVFLSSGIMMHERSVMSAGIDGKIKVWDMSSGLLLNEHLTGHLDFVSRFSTFVESDGLINNKTGAHASDKKSHSLGGTITASLDGTVRLRCLVPNGTHV